MVGAIIPWNAPVALICHKIGPALLAGCTVVLKSSPEAPGEGYVFAEVAEQIGLPPGVLNVVTADREVSELLVRDPRRRQDHLHRIDRGRPAHRVAVRRADRPVHARARRQVGGGRSSTTWTSATAAKTLAARRVRAQRAGVLVAHADRRDAGPPRRAGRGARGELRRRRASATRSTSSRSSGPLVCRAPARPRRGLHRQGRRGGRDARDRWRPARRTSTAAATSSRPCSATSTTARRSARRRSSARCSA